MHTLEGETLYKHEATEQSKLQKSPLLTTHWVCLLPAFQLQSLENESRPLCPHL